MKYRWIIACQCFLKTVSCSYFPFNRLSSTWRGMVESFCFIASRHPAYVFRNVSLHCHGDSYKFIKYISFTLLGTIFEHLMTKRSIYSMASCMISFLQWMHDKLDYRLNYYNDVNNLSLFDLQNRIQKRMPIALLCIGSSIGRRPTTPSK